MGDEIAGMSVIDGRLGLRLPRLVGAGIVREHADDVDLVDILELVAPGIDKLAAEDEVQESGHLAPFRNGVFRIPRKIPFAPGQSIGASQSGPVNRPCAAPSAPGAAPPAPRSRRAPRPGGG